MFAGEGHGAIVALKSLQKKFACIEILSSDDDVLILKRENDAILKGFSEGKSKYVVLAGYKKIISPNFLQEKIFINIHPSLLPEYRGFHSVVWAMLNCEKELGLSFHLVNEYMDDGDILYQHKVSYDGQTSKEIMDEFDAFVEYELGNIVCDFILEKIHPVKQDKSKATWVGKRNLDDCIIDYSWSCKRLQMLFKALVKPYPLPRIIVRKEIFEVANSKIVSCKNYFTDVGRVLNIDSEGVWIKTKEGFLVTNLLVDLKNEKTIPAKDILNLGMRLL